MPSPSTAAPARSQFWDIVRGIGILSIVMGHCFAPSIIYVYTYHLAVFFFVSGFLYNEKKYAHDPFGHFAAKLKSSWPKYMFYMCMFILLHNLFQAIGLTPPADKYTVSQAMEQLGNAFIFNGMEALGGALWFVPTWVLVCGIFGATVWIAFRLFPQNPENPSQGTVFRALIVAAVSAFFSFCGAFLIFHETVIIYRVQLVLFIQIIFAAGWLVKTCIPRFKTFLKWYIGILCAFVLWMMITPRQLYFDLAVNRIGNGWLYFFLALLGICCCMVLASLLEKTGKLGHIFAFWGKHSFDIMALHFFIFKIIDGCYGRIFGYSPEYYSAFPHSFGKILWPVYVLLGTTLPALLGSKLERIGKQCR